MEMELQEFVDPAVELRRDSLPEAEPNRGAQVRDHFGLVSSTVHDAVLPELGLVAPATGAGRDRFLEARSTVQVRLAAAACASCVAAGAGSHGGHLGRAPTRREGDRDEGSFEGPWPGT